MDSLKRKPCPFCGGEADISLSNADRGLWVIVRCNKCMANIQKKIPYASRTSEQWSVPLKNVIDKFVDAAAEWDSRRAEQDSLSKYFDSLRERIERQMDEITFKRDVLKFCETKTEKAHTDGFIDGLGWLLEIMDDEETFTDKNDEG